MEFEWDERKHELNIQKHGVSFLSAARVFDGPVFTIIDNRKDYGEPIEMSEENIVRYSRDDLPEDSKTDWNRVAVLTEEELNAAARSDPDAPPFMNAEDWEKTEILAQIPIDRGTFEYCTKHGGGIQTVIRNAVREYMDTHPLN